MVTNFNTKDLVSFGKHLLSKEREERLKQTNIENPNALPYEEAKREVYDADLKNWKEDMSKSASDLLNEFLNQHMYIEVSLLHKEDFRSDFNEWMSNK